MNEYLKADLHVHTPASDCYIGKKCDETYVSILEKAKSENIGILAITDHNTLKGYEKLMELKCKFITEYEVLTKYVASGILGSAEILTQLQRKIELFNSVYIIPGVEITVNPGVHVLVLSSEESMEDIKGLLLKLGYSNDKQGFDSFVPNMDVKEFLEQVELRGKIVICPHVDRDKGIYNVLNGAYRAHIFKSSVINGFTCNSVNQLRNIKNDLFKQPDYRRTSPLAFINASDAHDIDSIGSKYSFFKLTTQPLFESLVSAFCNPEQSISDDNNPKLKSIIRKCIESGKAVVLTTANKEELVKSICAVLNNGYGHILIGVTQDIDIFGVQSTKNDLELLFFSTLNDIAVEGGQATCQLIMEEIGSGRAIGIVTLSSEGRKIWYDNTQSVYIFKEEGKIGKANIKDIERIIYNNIITDLKECDKKINSEIDSIVLRCEYLRNNVKKYELANKISIASLPFAIYADLQFISGNSTIGKYWEKFTKTGNGYSDGNAVIIPKAQTRLEDAYLRCTSPFMDIDETDTDRFQKFSYPAIIMSCDGGCFLVEKNEWYLISQYDVLIITLNKNGRADNISLHAILAWLKSSALAWYSLWRFDSINLFSNKAIMKALLPHKEMLIENEILANSIKKITVLEKDYLDKCRELINNEDLFEEITNKHNLKVLEIAREIDSIINRKYEFSTNDINMISDTIKSHNIFDYLANVEPSDA